MFVKGIKMSDEFELFSERDCEWLAKGTVVYANHHNIWEMGRGEHDTHTAILVCVRPIEPEDSLEKLAQDIVTSGSVLDIHTRESLEYTLKRLFERAGKLIGAKK